MILVLSKIKCICELIHTVLDLLLALCQCFFGHLNLKSLFKVGPFTSVVQVADFLANKHWCRLQVFTRLDKIRLLYFINCVWPVRIICRVRLFRLCYIRFSLLRLGFFSFALCLMFPKQFCRLAMHSFLFLFFILVVARHHSARNIN